MDGRARPHIRGELPFLRSGPLWRIHTDAEPLLDDLLTRYPFRRFDLDGRAMTSRAAAHAELARVFGFPDWYGGNWDAFNDCFGHVAAGLAGELVAVVWHDAAVAARAAPASAVEVGWALLECATGGMPSLPPGVPTYAVLHVFALGTDPDFDRPT